MSFFIPDINMNVILFDDPAVRADLLPLTFTRPVADIRIGILTIREKWEHYLEASTSTLTEEYLSKKYPLTTGSRNIWINGAVCPDAKLLSEIMQLKEKQSLVAGETLVAFHSGDGKELVREPSDKVISKSEPLCVLKPWHIFSMNGRAIQEDFELLTKGRKSQPLSSTNRVLGNNIFVEEGAKVECSVLNTTTGPIYIGKDAEIMEGCLVRGPFALCDHGTLKMSAKIYGPSTVGPYCRVAGEVNNSVIFGYSNKGHEGFLGNSVLGEWCNIGADSNNSNLKNNYAEVKLWNYPQERFVGTGLQFCGLIMGDHSKCGINTMFNTGTVVGVNANIFGSGFPRNFVPSFSWGGAAGFTTYKLRDAFEVAARVFERRDKTFDDTEKAILEKVFELTERFRK
jgi:UDP-N-acetylglucosamine diphosphorylase/glucosamine-1-phosphate N-acetyltransferase